MADAKRDSNQVTTLLAVSNADSSTPVTLYADPVTHRLLTSNAASTPTTITVANEATDTTSFPLFVTAATGDLGPKTNAGLTFNSNTANLQSTLLSSSSLTASEILITDASKNLVSAAVATYPSLTELTYVKGLTSSAQTQITAKAPSTSPTFATSITGSYLTASEILITDGSKNIVSAAVATYPSLTELTYVKGVTSAIQTQLGTKQATITFGTGVETALGVNVGSAGAPVLFDGAGGTPSSLTGTNITGTASGLTAGTVTTNANLTGIVTSTGNATAIADKAISYTKLADGTDGELITWNSSGVAATVAAGSSGEVLTSNGAGAAPTFQAIPASGGVPQGSVSTIFETAARFTSTLTGSGTVTFGVNGMVITPSATITGGSNQRLAVSNVAGAWNPFTSNSYFTAYYKIGQGTDHNIFVGVGDTNSTGGGITFTTDQYGFKYIRTTSSTVVSATNANGTTETATDVTGSSPTLGAGNQWHAQKNGTTNIKFYANQTLLATHTTNLPDGTAANFGQFNISNRGVATDSDLTISSYTYGQDSQ